MNQVLSLATPPSVGLYFRRFLIGLLALPVFLFLASPVAAADTTAPSTPTNLVAVVKNTTRVDLSWTVSTDDVAVRGYRVFANGTLVGKNSLPRLAVLNLTPGTTYSFEVVAFDGAGNLSGAALVSATTQGTAPSNQTPPPVSMVDTEAPSQPTELSYTQVGDTRLNLTWTPSTDNVEVRGYRVWLNGAYQGANSLPRYTLVNLIPGSAYKVEVAAFDARGNLSEKTKLRALTGGVDATAPSNPGNVKAAPLLWDTARLMWQASSDNLELAGYQVYLNGTLVDTTTATKFEFSNLEAGTTYVLAVEAFDISGNSSGLIEVSVTTKSSR